MSEAIVVIGGPMDGQMVEMGMPPPTFLRVPEGKDLGLAPGDAIGRLMNYTLRTFHKVGKTDVVAYVAEATAADVVDSRVEHIFYTRSE